MPFLLGREAGERGPELVAVVASRLLDCHFPSIIQPDVAATVGLDPATLTDSRASERLQRDPTFRLRVLTAYEWRCALCGLDLRLGQVTVAPDAAHIRWHQAGGPHSETNGLSLCVLHHKLFDLGAFTLGHDGEVLVSDQANGSTGL